MIGSPGRSASLPGYVRRDHDTSTRKTRACWEAIQGLWPNGWRLWHPYHPSRAEAAVAGLDRVGPRTVVRPNDAQNYFGDSGHGEAIAAALHTLVTDPGRGPVLVLGTLRPEHVARYCVPTRAEDRDEHARVRELLAGRLVAVPETAARLTHGGRRLHLRLSATWPWRHDLAAAFHRLAALPRPAS